MERRRCQRGMSFLEIVGIVALVAIIGVVLYVAFSQPSQSNQVTTADGSGQGSFKFPDLPDTTFTAQCSSDGMPTFSAPSEGYVRNVKPVFTKVSSGPCQPPKEGCTTSEWAVTATRESMGADSKWHSSGPYDFGKLVCPCSCAKSQATRILELQWKDFERRPYPNHEHATYYGVHFTLTDPHTGKELANWNAWVRVPGGHTHYGYFGSKPIEIDPQQCPDSKLVECAQRALGAEFTSPPVAQPQPNV